MNSVWDDIRNTFYRSNNAVMQLVVLNILGFVVINLVALLLFLSVGQNYLGIYTTVIYYTALPIQPTELLWKPWTLITHIFLHQDFWHLLFNLLFLYWFGKIVEEFLGSRRVLSLYVIGALAGVAGIYLIYPLIPNYVGRGVAYGASAGVTAVVCGAATLRPNLVVLLFGILPVQIKYIAIFQVLLFAFGLRGGNAGGEVAHLCGAAWGYIFILQLQRGYDWGAWLNRLLGIFRRRPKMRATHINRPNRVTVSTTAHTKSYNKNESISLTDQDEIDAILDKINLHGIDSLTKEERQKLKQAGN